MTLKAISLVVMRSQFSAKYINDSMFIEVLSRWYNVNI